MDDPHATRPASLALLGGEGLRQPDAGIWPHLLAAQGENHPRIALVTAALAAERAEMREQRARLITQSLAELGAAVTAADTASPGDPAGDGLAALQQADAIVLAGGDARSLVEALTVHAREAIATAQRSGALLIAAGGASTALGEICFGPARPTPADATAFELETAPGLGIVPGAAILPYFAWLQPDMITAIRERVGDNLRLIGIDDQAGLVWGGARWAVHGAGSVTVIAPDDSRATFDVGQPIPEGPIPAPAYSTPH